MRKRKVEMDGHNVSFETCQRVAKAFSENKDREAFFEVVNTPGVSSFAAMAFAIQVFRILPRGASDRFVEFIQA